MDYDIRLQELGLAPKESIKAIVLSYIESGKTNIPLFLDIRSDSERAEAQLKSQLSVVHIVATTSDTSALDQNASKCFPNKDDPIIVFCKSGRRAAAAKSKLETLGYKHVYNAGGLSDLTYFYTDMGLVCTRQAHVLTIHPNEPEPRLEQVPTTPENLTTEMQQTLSLIPGDGLKGKGFPHNVLGQLLHSGEQLGPFLAYWVHGKNTMSLNIREQELVILRMAVLYKSEYVWRHHVLVGRGYKITPYQLIELKREDYDFDMYHSFVDRECALLLLTDEMVNHRCVRRRIWDEVRRKGKLTNRDIIDLIHLISQYTLFALTNNVMQVPLEESMVDIGPSLQ